MVGRAWKKEVGGKKLAGGPLKKQSYKRKERETLVVEQL
jgi:hypothetical protein